MEIPSLDSYLVITFRVGPLIIALGAWTILCGCIGFIIGYRPRPTRVIFLPENHRKLYESEQPMDLRTGTRPSPN